MSGASGANAITTARSTLDFVYRRRVAFHETDSMGVVHHSKYICFFEEARVHWLRHCGLIDLHIPVGPYTFAVVDLDCQYLKPLKFDEEFEVRLQVRLEGARMLFQYAVRSTSADQWAATGRTVLAVLNSELKPVRLPTKFRDAFAQSPWQDSWPPA